MGSTDNNGCEPIPQPPQHLYGLLGNLPDIDPAFPIKEVWRLAQLYGPIMRLNLNGDHIYVSSRELVNEVCDEKRFHKHIGQVLKEVRALLGDGLFTAFPKEPNWGRAHRMLVPAFGPIGIRKMFDGMQDIASQMVLRWDRLGPEHEIDCGDDLTRLAFDTIGLCAFSYRFNEFYTDNAHPFAQQMADVLVESGKKANRPPLLQRLYHRSEQQRQDQVQEMWKLCDKIVADRKKHPQPDNHDLLNTMLNTVDRGTGEGLSDENIRFQLATFLVAGHETTSATLSFTYLNMLQNPATLLKAQRQVDEVVGDDVLTVEHLSKLDYIDACIKETLRLSSPIGAFTVGSDEDQVLAGKYFVPKNTEITILNKLLHRDPAVWDDPDSFKPERWLNGGLQKLPPNSFKPFGSGMRACIGRGFAEQEMIINFAMVLQRFQLELADPSYELQLKSTLTIKPWQFRMKVRRRQGKSPHVGIPGGLQKATEKEHRTHQAAHRPAKDDGGEEAFGGTCEALAQSLQTACSDHGFEATIAGLDAATEHAPTDQPVIVITSSYEGQPPDNARKFVHWLGELDPQKQALKHVKYAVFGVGNSDWASTYHKIPRLVDDLAAKNGAQQIISAGFSNVKEDPIGPWEDWSDKLLEVLSGDKSVTKEKTTLQANIEPDPLSRTLGGMEMNYGTIITNRELAGTEVGPAKRHLEIQLPHDADYQAGDYLVVQPHNPPESIHRVLAHFDLNDTDLVTFTNSPKKYLPSTPTPVGTFLAEAVELATPITKRQLESLAPYATTSEQKSALQNYITTYNTTTLTNRYSPLDILTTLSLTTVPFPHYIDLLPPLSPRQYSISSSPLVQPESVSLTIDVHSSPALSGTGLFQGVASTYLATRRMGDRISCFIRPTNVGFRIPSVDVPLIMICAGTGIAPMRAFLQERSAIAAAGIKTLAPALLYFGCRHRDHDNLYTSDLSTYETAGIVKIRTAFSKVGPNAPSYVPDLVWEDREEIADLFTAGGKIFLCGSAARLGRSTDDVCKKIWVERTGKTSEEAEEWLRGVRMERYVSDVY
ncbi:Bifunctional cytochrome P450/NADPH--P450 reductase [Fulvia fulva]|nr:Bifunctional cytochrome P450/NADPH--P450 reductase [Fulvia fulva]WPV14213.1 Bifunctional cytochrome P450/NADPH--P450 reductase [Fulvia fulva]